MPKSDYTYSIQTYNQRPFIVIEDLNKGGMSVTNNIEYIIDEIAQKERLNPVEHFIIYRDSEGQWDGFNYATGLFVHLAKFNYKDAAEGMLKAQTN